MEAPSSLQSLRARAALRDAFALAPEAAVKAGVATVLTINADGDYKVEQPADEVAFMAAPAATAALQDMLKLVPDDADDYWVVHDESLLSPRDGAQRLERSVMLKLRADDERRARLELAVRRQRIDMIENVASQATARVELIERLAQEDRAVHKDARSDKDRDAQRQQVMNDIKQILGFEDVSRARLLSVAARESELVRAAALPLVAVR